MNDELLKKLTLYFLTERNNKEKPMNSSPHCPHCGQPILTQPLEWDEQ